MGGGFRNPETTMSAASTWPDTVAKAAPATPSAGAGPRPKIRIGSSTILAAAPAIWANMFRRMLPRAWWTLLQVLSRNTPGLPTQTMVPYVTARSATEEDSVEIAAKGRISRPLNTAKISQLISARTVPVPAVRSARWWFPWPSYRDIRVLTPTPVPTAMAVTIS